MKTMRELAKDNAIALIEENLDVYNEWAHRSHNHIWIEALPDGSVHQTEEADMNTTHWIIYPNKAIANILTIACCEYCDCDACASYDQAHDDYIDDDEFKSRWRYRKCDVDDDFSKHLKDCEMYDYDMADNAVAAIDKIDYGYFDDED